MFGFVKCCGLRGEGRKDYEEGLRYGVTLKLLWVYQTYKTIIHKGYVFFGKWNIFLRPIQSNTLRENGVSCCRLNKQLPLLHGDTKYNNSMLLHLIV